VLAPPPDLQSQKNTAGRQKGNIPMNPLILLKKTSPVFVVALVCFGLLPTMQAVSPAPDGAYPGGNTAEGQSALFNLTTGGFNTGVGFLSLRSNATGQLNTAIGAGTLLANTADENTATGAGALLSNTTGAKTRPMERSRSLATPLVTIIMRLALKRSLATPPGPSTMHSAIARSLPTPQATETRRWVKARCLPTPLGRRTQRSV
jgi:hypothetical protein